MNIAELCAATCQDETGIRRWVSDGVIPAPRRVNGREVWQWSSVERAMERNTEDIRIYFVRFLDFIKIGISSDLAQRLWQIERSLPAPMVLLHDMPGSYDLERDLHERFKGFRARGEWFHCCKEILDFIETVKRERLGNDNRQTILRTGS